MVWYLEEWLVARSTRPGKRDYQRFPGLHLRDDDPVEAVTPFSKTTMRAAAKAFAALMQHLKQADSTQRTVILIQVENEGGLIGDPWARGELANKTYAQPVPAALTNYLKK